jgi:hypothetical protein
MKKKFAMLKRVEQDYSREIREVQSYMIPHLKDPVDAYHELKLRVWHLAQCSSHTLCPRV